MFSYTKLRSTGTNMTCTALISTCSAVINMVSENPTSFSIYTTIQTVVTAVFHCSDEEKQSLVSVGENIGSAIEEVQGEIEHVSLNLVHLSGVSFSSSAIAGFEICETEEDCNSIIQIETTRAPPTTESSGETPVSMGPSSSSSVSMGSSSSSTPSMGSSLSRSTPIMTTVSQRKRVLFITKRRRGKSL